MTDTSLAAVVVNHNAGEALISCVKSLRDAGIDEIVVVDNASTDGSLARLSKADVKVTLVPTGANPGYGAAANIGVARLKTDYVLICNPDLFVDEKAPAELAQVLDEHPDIAVAGPRVMENSGSLYPSARSFPQLNDAIGHAFVGLFQPNNRWSKRYRDEMTQEETTHAVDWVSGACLLVRRVAFTSVGGFDDGYFMYVEDLDLCWRLRRGGWQTFYVPSATVTHEQGGSSREHPYRLLVAHHESTWRFARRSAPQSQRALLPVIGAGIGVRLVLALFRTFFHAQKANVGRHVPGVD